MYTVDFHYPGGSCKARLNKAGRLSFVEPLVTLDIADALVGNTAGQQWRREALRDCNDFPHHPISHRYTGALVRILFLHCFAHLVGARLSVSRSYSHALPTDSTFCTTGSGSDGSVQIRLIHAHTWWRLYQAGEVFGTYRGQPCFVLAQVPQKRVIAYEHRNGQAGYMTYTTQHYHPQEGKSVGAWE